MDFARFDADLFLRDHWQKRPLLIRNPWRSWNNPLEPDELAGLACEDLVESRLIVRGGDRLVLENGPLPEARFAALGDRDWTLLVQAVDHHVPEVAALIEPFRFVPDWRIDDVMVSYATDGGGVGPHFDQYDVFLIQGLGRRRWRVGQRCDANTPLAPHDDLRLIADFAATDEWILEPGDILYVPPGFAHDGVAVGDDCMTYSVGFRAPSRSELVEGWSAQVADMLAEDDRYSDPDLVPQPNPGEIAPAAIERLQAMVLEVLADRDRFARWFGTLATEPKYPNADWRPDAQMPPEEVQARLAAGDPMLRNPASRYSFIRQDAGDSLLFVDGQCHDCRDEAAPVAEALCLSPHPRLDPASASSPAVVALLAALVNAGSLAFADED